MRSVQIVLLLLFALTVSTATGKLNWEKLRGEFFNVTGTEGTLFVQSLNYLHRAPPQEETLDRANSRKVSTKTIEQKLDHFNSTNEKTWQMVSNWLFINPGFDENSKINSCLTAVHGKR